MTNPLTAEERQHLKAICEQWANIRHLGPQKRDVLIVALRKAEETISQLEERVKELERGLRLIQLRTRSYKGLMAREVCGIAADTLFSPALKDTQEEENTNHES